MRTYKAARDLLSSPRWHRIYNAGLIRNASCGRALEQRIRLHPTFCTLKPLAAPFTVNTMPEATLKALANRKELGSILPADGGDCEEVLSRFAEAGINIDALAAQLQDEGAKSFVKSWNELMSVVDSKTGGLEKVAS